MRNVLVAGVLLLAAVGRVSRLYGQAGQAPSEAKPLTFEVASVKADMTNAPATSRFPLGPGDAYVPSSLFTATNYPLIVYIRFAFGRSQGEMLSAPSWVYDERFDIQARAAGERSKDDMRLLVRALLAERFKLAWHIEQREVSVLALMVATPGRFGPHLTPHAQDQPCGQDPKFAGIPCGSAGLVAASDPARGRVSGRAEPIGRLAAVLSNNAFAGVDRIVIDRTGLVGQFDFTIEWAIPQPSVELQSAVDATGPSLGAALREQLGLKLESTRAPVDVLVIDHVERPTPD